MTVKFLVAMKRGSIWKGPMSCDTKDSTLQVIPLFPPIPGKSNISSSVDLYFQPQKPGDKRVMFKSLFFAALLTNNRRAIEYKLYNCN